MLSQKTKNNLNYFIEKLKPRTQIDVVNWCENNIKFSGGFDSQPFYSISKSPWHRHLFNWLTDSETRVITCIASTQIGKSTALIASCLYNIFNNPSPSLIIFPTEDTCRSFFRRFAATLNTSIPNALPNDFSENLGGVINNSYLSLAWATSRARLKSKPIKYVYADETAEYKTSLNVIMARTKSFKDSKILFTTSPEEEDEQTYTLYKYGSQMYEINYPCPYCGSFNKFEFKNLVFQHLRNDNGKFNYDRVENQTYYKCPGCDGQINSYQHQLMLENGILKCLTPERSPQRKSIKLTCFDSSVNTLGAIARKFLETRDTEGDRREFSTGYLAEPYKPVGNGLRGKLLKERNLNLEPNICPANTKYLLAGIDVQGKGELYIVVRAFLEDGRSVLVNAVKLVNNDMDALLNLLKDYLNTEFIWDGHNDKIKISCAAIDSGDGNNTARIYKACLSNRDLLIPIKGIKEKTNSLLSTSLVENYPNSEIKINPPLVLYRVRTSSYRNKIMENYTKSLSEAGAWLACKNVDTSYYDSLESWELVRDHRGTHWNKQISQEDHYLDAECYCAALCDINEGKEFNKSIVSIKKKKLIRVINNECNNPIQWTF